ncbi:MAG: glycosyltransferase [Magnetovibrionaceae bacterium]
MTSDMIVFGEDWGAHPSSTQHLVRRLSVDRRVVWVNSIGLRRPRLDAKDARRVWNKARAVMGRRQAPKVSSKRTSAPFPVVEPLCIPWPGNPVAGWANGHLLGRRVGGAAGAADLQRPILWTSLPSAVDALGHLGERAVVYYAGDDFGALSGVDHAAVEEQERRLADKADLIIAASPLIAAKFDPCKTRVLPHGIDEGFLGAPGLRPLDLPQGPVAGFYGSLSDWLDQDLIRETAKRLPNWTFVLIGEERCDLSKLKAVANIKLLGPRAHHELPAYAAHWTASLIPFRDTAQIRACNPLKLREYLSLGRPIVTTDFPALEGYRELVTVADRAEDWTDALIKACFEPVEVLGKRRLAMASETWDARAEELSEWLSAL